MLELAKNAALLVVLCHVYAIALRARLGNGSGAQLLRGALVGGICIIGMLTPFEAAPGSLLDARTAILGMAGLFGGPLLSLTAASVAAAFRAFLGGAGAEVGILTIFASTLLGLLYRSLRHRRHLAVGGPQLLLFGFVVHASILLIWLRLPVEVRDTVFRHGALPFLAILTPATALLGLHLLENIRRARTIRALEESESRLRATVNAIPDQLFEVAPNGRIHDYRSPRPERRPERREHFIGRNLRDVFSRDAAAAFAAALQEAQEKGTSVGKEYELRESGNPSWFELSAAAKPVRAGNQQRFIILARDITKRRQTEAQLRKLALTVDQSHNSVIITDIDGKIEYVNEAFVINSGYRREEALGRTPGFLNSGRTPRRTFDDFRNAMRGGQTWNGTFHNRRKDGSEYVEFAIVSPIREADGRVTHYVAVKEDITEKTRMAAELDRHRNHLEDLVRSRTTALVEAREAADAANRAKSSFVANMSHEIRTPMNAIVGLTHLLRRAGPTPQQAELLGKIDTAAGHLLAIVDNILDISRIEAGRLELEKTDFHLSAILDDARSMIAGQARAKGLTVEVDARNTPGWLRGDPTRLRQALLNYLGNAVKFTERGKITVRAILLEEKDDKVEISFEVEDTGVGIAPEKIPAVFETFEQADTSTARKYGGSGLGLAITRRLARLMDGDAGAVSEPGRGSTFWFTAELERGHGTPPAAACAGPDEAEAELRRRGTGRRVLLVDDSPVNREIAAEMLRGIGLEVVTAESGPEAVERARAGDCGLILMDMQMPQMDGLEAAARIRRLPGRDATPIVAVTASAFDEDRRACLDAGMDDFLTKPVTRDALYAALRKWLPRDDPAPWSAMPSAPPRAEPPGSLAAIPQLDAARAVALVNGNDPKYRRVLALFRDIHAGDAERLGAAFAAGDLELVRTLAHALQGAAAMIGAVGVASAASALQRIAQPGAAPGETAAACAALTAELGPFLDALAHATADGTPALLDRYASRAGGKLAELA